MWYTLHYRKAKPKTRSTYLGLSIDCLVIQTPVEDEEEEEDEGEEEDDRETDGVRVRLMETIGQKD